MTSVWLQSLDTIEQILRSVFFDMGSRICLVYAPFTLALAYVAYRCTGASRGPSFWRYALPPQVYAHPSQSTDWKLLFTGALLQVFGVLSFGGLASFSFASSRALLVDGLGITEGKIATGAGVFFVLTLVSVVTSDFCSYWVHRLHHRVPFLWPFHSVHHSAEVMSPITLYRKHPIYDLLTEGTIAAGSGFVQGIIVTALVGPPEIWTIGGANAMYVAFHLLGSNLRHSSVWLDYGPRLDHVVVSPAQHQIHHSREPRHLDKNYGEIFALWDWMFGSLYVPVGREQFAIGLSDRSGEPIAQPHAGLRAALVQPFRDVAGELVRRIHRTPA